MEKLSVKKPRVKRGTRRLLVQIAATILYNADVRGYVSGSIHQGVSKYVCVPGLNCYSCPGAVGSCPVGSLQAVIGGRKHDFSFYVLGFLLLFAALFGRLVCGFLCPFGLVQDLIHRIKVKRLTIPKAVDRPLRYLKYVILVVLVIVLPITLTNAYGVGAPYFCKLLCPAGTLGAGIPLVIRNASLREGLGFLFWWKLSLLVAILTLSLFVYRPFCKYLCPLGAFYALFNRVALYRMDVNEQSCIHCGACARACKMGVDVTKQANAMECIRCGDCISACPTNAVSGGFRISAKKAQSTPPEQTEEQPVK